ncbi:carbohydrate ABC transporter permease [Actinomadura livida]|uniref:Carbohydrate ABC transporter permease n=1 Tax=Actinomadura livida TaxID=79909 RepID=A0A7W7IBS2_9ACTN|nr:MULTISPECIES: carbohydrate ABC transporter permease [Actinomadura]MBB4774191.1 glucose/mannose transport system permease protein [Actinomadura catellatispora]GGT84254.1 ABC transporter permease [Actinomadura livida]
MTVMRAPGGMSRTGRTVRLAILLAFVVLFLIPVYVLVVTSFKPLDEADPSSAWSLPERWSTSGWSAAWTELKGGLANSVKIAVSGSIISAVLGSLNGYVLSKWRFPGADVVFTLFLFGMFIPYQAVMIPLAGLLTDIELSGTIRGIVLAHVVYGIPICTLIFRNYYVTIPDELIEAARVDGAGMLRAYWSVVLPVSGPAFAVTLIWQFTSMWNDFLFAVFLGAPDSWPVTVMLNNTAGSGAVAVQYNVQMASALLASLPTLLVYLLLGRFFMRGLMAGALKG